MICIEHIYYLCNKFYYYLFIIYVINSIHLYHHIVVLDKYIHSSLV